MLLESRRTLPAQAAPAIPDLQRAERDQPAAADPQCALSRSAAARKKRWLGCCMCRICVRSVEPSTFRPNKALDPTHTLPRLRLGRVRAAQGPAVGAPAKAGE